MNYEQAQKLSKLKKDNEFLLEQVKGLTEAVESIKARTGDSEAEEVVTELRKQNNLLKEENAELKRAIEKAEADFFELNQEKEKFEKLYDKVKRGKRKNETNEGVKHGPKSRR